MTIDVTRITGKRNLELSRKRMEAMRYDTNVRIDSIARRLSLMETVIIGQLIAIVVIRVAVVISLITT